MSMLILLRHTETNSRSPAHANWHLCCPYETPKGMFFISYISYPKSAMHVDFSAVLRLLLSTFGTCCSLHLVNNIVSPLYSLFGVQAVFPFCMCLLRMFSSSDVWVYIYISAVIKIWARDVTFTYKNCLTAWPAQIHVIYMQPEEYLQ